VAAGLLLRGAIVTEFSVMEGMSGMQEVGCGRIHEPMLNGESDRPQGVFDPKKELIDEY